MTEAPPEIEVDELDSDSDYDPHDGHSDHGSDLWTATPSVAQSSGTLSARAAGDGRKKSANTAAKLANFNAGRVYFFSPGHPRYDASRNMDPNLRDPLLQWGKKNDGHALERALWTHCRDLQKRFVMARNRRDRPKALRTVSSGARWV